MTRTFVETSKFTKKWKEMHLSDDSLRELQETILVDPKIGAVIRGTGKLRKMRFAFQNQGKRGSTRICYVDFEIKQTIYFMDIFAKNEKENLSIEERNNLKKVIGILEMNL